MRCRCPDFLLAKILRSEEIEEKYYTNTFHKLFTSTEILFIQIGHSGIYEGFMWEERGGGYSLSRCDNLHINLCAILKGTMNSFRYIIKKTIGPWVLLSIFCSQTIVAEMARVSAITSTSLYPNTLGSFDILVYPLVWMLPRSMSNLTLDG